MNVSENESVMLSGSIPIETAVDPFDPSMLILGQRPMSSMSDAELIAGIEQLRSIRDPLQMHKIRKSLKTRGVTNADAGSRAKPSTKSTKSMDDAAVSFLTSLFEENE